MFCYCRVGISDILLSSFLLEGREKWKERKGWFVMIYDLFGFLVVVVFMVIFFVLLVGFDYVVCLNLGVWLILCLEFFGVDSWRFWGCLEVWRERGGKGMGFWFKFMVEGGGVLGVGSGVLSLEIFLFVKKGGEFIIDVRRFKMEVFFGIFLVGVFRVSSLSLKSSGELYFGLGLYGVGEFVMSCGV